VVEEAWEDLRPEGTDSPLDPLPLRGHLKGYNLPTAKGDLKAAAEGAMLSFTQGMAYALVAGLPLQYGITCAIVASIFGPLLCQSRLIILGPTNATAFMIFSYFAAYPNMNQERLMPLLVFLVAALLIAGALLRVAELTQFISRTVVVSYVTGASLLIMVNQLPSVLGIARSDLAEDGSSPVTLPGILWAVATHLTLAQWMSVAVAILAMACYAAVRRWRPLWPALAVSLVVVSAISAALASLGFTPSTFSDATFSWHELIPAFPNFMTKSTLPDIGRLFGLAMAVAFVAALESSVMAKTIASRTNQRVDQNQDMLGLGAANLACMYLSGMPASTSPTRSTLNHSAGARTPMASMVGGLLCLVAALTLGGAVAFVPRAALAMLVICIAASLLNPSHIRICLTATGADAAVFLITVGATLILPLHVAIFAGVAVSVVLYLRKASRPTLVEYGFNPEGQLTEAPEGGRQHPSISIVHVEGELFFGAAEIFRTQIQHSFADPNLRIVILRLKNARHLDATSVMALEELIRVLRSGGRDLIISGAMKDIYRVLKGSGLVKVIGKENIFPGSPSNPNIATRNALKRAQEILGVEEPEVHIFYDASKSKKS
jgi:SulP family sulfate permease